MSTLRYALRIEAPARHLVEVELRFAADGDTVDVTMPAWCPGSYLIRDYARFVRDFRATGADGSARTATKVDKQTWRIETAGAREIVVTYTLYGHDLTVRTNHVDEAHAFLHGPATFVYPTAQRGARCEVRVEGRPAGWEVTCAAKRVGDALVAANIDELYDHPIHIGAVRTFTVPSSVPCKLAIWGDKAPGGVFDETRLATDLAAIVDDHVKRFGVAPFDDYTFILMLSHDAYGGLEHRASSVNLFHPHFAATRKAYEGLLELLSHELFHAWNGKRIAPRPLFDFDYSREAYTPCLWVMEGVTSHYDRFALRSSGRITAKSYLEKVLDDWSRLMATPGRAKQSLEQSSFDAWIKLYKPDESNLNTTVSYYLKGGLAMFALDLFIRRTTDGAKSLDDALRLLWTRYGAVGEPHPDNVQPVFEDATGIALGDFFDRYVRGTDDPELREELAFAGLELRATNDPAPSSASDSGQAPWLGLTLASTKVTAVLDGTPAQAAGVSPGDEIIAVDGFRVTNDADLRNAVAPRKLGETLQLSLFRRHRLLTVPVPLEKAPATRYELATVAEPSPAVASRFQAWLGEPYPGAAQIVATITTTARWV